MPKLCKHIYVLLLCFFSLGPISLIAQTKEDDIGDSLKQAGNYAAALKIFQKALKDDSTRGNLKNQSKDLNNIANVYSDIGDYEKSTQFYFQSIKLAEKAGDTYTQIVIDYNIANNYFSAGKLNYSTDFLNKAITLIGNDKTDESILGRCYTMLGGILTEQKKYRQATDYFQKAERLFNDTSQADNLANVYVNMANLGTEEQDYKVAEENSRKSLEIYKRLKDSMGIAVAYINLQMAHTIVSQETAIELTRRKELLLSLQLLDSAEYAIKGLSAPEVRIRIYENKHQLFRDLKQYDSAYVYQGNYLKLNDSIHAIEKNKQLDELKVQYDFGNQEQKNLLLAKENEVLTARAQKRKILITAILTGSALALVLLLLIIVRSNNRKKQKELEFEKSALELEQQALRAQMNPHFIFNAINSIQKYILKNSKQEAYDYLAKFAKLIRIVLHNSQERALMLKQEVEMIELYVELEQLRFNNAFDFTLNTDKNILQHEVSVPPMLIQPYIENAIWHGLMNLERERKGLLTVNITESGGILKVIIEDNGIGRERAKEYKKEDSHKSVGMKLTEQRLLMINKMPEYENAKVIITDLYDGNKWPCGTRVEIFIPIHGK